MLTEIAAHPLVYALPPVLGVLGGIGAALLGWWLSFASEHRSVLASKTEPLAASIAALVGKELSAQELLSRLDPELIADRLDGPLRKLVDETTVELMQRHKPDLWELLPLRVKRMVIERARSKAPDLAKAILAAIETDAGDVLELEPLVYRVLTEEPGLLARIGRAVSAPVRAAITRRTAVLGFVFGLLESVLLAASRTPLTVALAPIVLLPLARWIAALPLGADPRGKRAKLAGLLSERIAADVLSFANIITELLSGARAERVHQLVRREVTSAIDEQASVAKPLLSAAIGANTFQEIKRGAVDRAIQGAPALTKLVDEYAEESMRVRTALAYRLRRAPSDRMREMSRATLTVARTRCTLAAVAFGVLIGAAQFWMAGGFVGVS